ncbi:hypothetical protein [Serratia odorifera]|uniref:Uncharacterized protein n=2 Tax=Serratia odorifera TaxID=618 RepID=D4E7E7_SEROD|nr:hypothetical protein [Serratia odorifera]EFE94002.1 hypothetical protein HMPREF0758_4097 [Serratia odorifera DSM 4582]PNK89124.1 hypothetical protein CEQ31_005100 [Serratia odorifera]RII69846.1 hypothetical protein DX901_21195 [Serratia odorifera]VDZ64127.1 Uncharacterised protein [Serratia odorifera]
MAEQVTVGCKLPNGLVLNVQGKQVKINGCRSKEARIIGGYGLTAVDKELWEAWLKIHAEQPYVKNGVIFAQDNGNSVRSQAKEQENIKSGLEPLPQKNPAPGIQRDDEAMNNKE